MPARQPLWRSRPPDGGAAGTLPMNLTAAGIDGRRGLVKVPSTPSMTGCELDVAGQRFAGLIVQAADGGADLIVGVGGDVFHEEVDEARIALQDGEDLQGAVGRARGRGGRRAGGLVAARRVRPRAARASSGREP